MKSVIYTSTRCSDAEVFHGILEIFVDESSDLFSNIGDPCPFKACKCVWNVLSASHGALKYRSHTRSSWYHSGGSSGRERGGGGIEAGWDHSGSFIWWGGGGGVKGCGFAGWVHSGGFILWGEKGEGFYRPEFTVAFQAWVHSGWKRGRVLQLNGITVAVWEREGFPI